MAESSENPPSLARFFYFKTTAQDGQKKKMTRETTSDNDAKKEEIIQNLFESSEVNNCYLANSAAMALYSTGRTNGLVVKSGEASTRAVPVFEGHVIPHAV